jgi:p-aminobenzoyl-glutamate transporter AbgT
MPSITTVLTLGILKQQLVNRFENSISYITVTNWFFFFLFLVGLFVLIGFVLLKLIENKHSDSIASNTKSPTGGIFHQNSSRRPSILKVLQAIPSPLPTV